MNKTQLKLRCLMGLIALIVAMAMPVDYYASDANVKKVTAESSEGIWVSVELKRQSVTYGEDVTIHYHVKNQGKKDVYLVQRPESTENASPDGTMWVGIEHPFPTNHGGYDYHFIRIKRGKSYSGKLVIHGATYKDLKIGVWRVDVTLSFVTNITGLNRKMKRDEDPAILRGGLASRLRDFTLCGLRVDTT